MVGARRMKGLCCMGRAAQCTLGGANVMADKVACTRCGASILASTAEKNGGLCMPCSTGTREQIDAGRQWYAERGARERDPSRVLWLSLVDRVHNTPLGFEGLSEPEMLYFSVVQMEGEVYNGGFDQYFFNSSGSHFEHAMRGLREMGANGSAAILERARQLLFPEGTVPSEASDRRAAIRDLPAKGSERERMLSQLEREFSDDPDDLAMLIASFAKRHQLVPVH